MSRLTLLSLQLLVAVVALVVWHVLTTVPLFGRIRAAVLLLQPDRCRQSGCEVVLHWRDLEAPFHYAVGNRSSLS